MQFFISWCLEEINGRLVATLVIKAGWFVTFFLFNLLQCLEGIGVGIIFWIDFSKIIALEEAKEITGLDAIANLQLQVSSFPNLIQFFLGFFVWVGDFLTCFSVIGPATIARILWSYKVVSGAEGDDLIMFWREHILTNLEEFIGFNT